MCIIYFNLWAIQCNLVALHPCTMREGFKSHMCPPLITILSFGEMVDLNSRTHPAIGCKSAVKGQMSIFGLACTKAGGTPLQGDRGGFDSLRVHKTGEVVQHLLPFKWSVKHISLFNKSGGDAYTLAYHHMRLLETPRSGNYIQVKWSCNEAYLLGCKSAETQKSPGS